MKVREAINAGLAKLGFKKFERINEKLTGSKV